MPKAAAAAAEIRGFYVILQLMGEQTVVVWDLETVPDLAAAARMLEKEFLRWHQYRLSSLAMPRQTISAKCSSTVLARHSA
jgi:hypothetical protein